MTRRGRGMTRARPLRARSGPPPSPPCHRRTCGGLCRDLEARIRPRIAQLTHERSMPEITGSELGANSAQEVDELRALEATLDLDLSEAEHLAAAVQGLLLDHR